MNEAQLRALTFSHRAARLAMAGVATGLFEEIADTPRTAHEVAAACGLAERGARVLLEALAALGVIERVCGAYLATAAARAVFCEKGEASRRHTVLHDLWHTGLWTRLEESLASGRPLDDRSGDPFFTRPDVLVRFFPNLAQAMVETTREEALELAEELALPAFARVLDLGGGGGHFARAIADAHPDAEVVLFDQPPVIAACGSAVHPRVQAVAGDFLVDPLDDARGAGFDRVLLSRVLMGLDDARAARAARPRARGAAAGRRGGRRGAAPWRRRRRPRRGSARRGHAAAHRRRRAQRRGAARAARGGGLSAGRAALAGTRCCSASRVERERPAPGTGRLDHGRRAGHRPGDRARVRRCGRRSLPHRAHRRRARGDGQAGVGARRRRRVVHGRRPLEEEVEAAHRRALERLRPGRRAGEQRRRLDREALPRLHATRSGPSRSIPTSPASSTARAPCCPR